MRPWSHLVDDAWPRFVLYVDAPGPFECWLWRGAKSRGKGNTDWYGSFWVGAGFVVRAHTFVCEAAGLHVPPGYHRDHVCVTSLCVNPLHLEPVTAVVNNDRRWRRDRPSPNR